MHNRVTLVGNLGRDPELRYTPSGQAVTDLNVATNRVWNDGNGNRQKETIWWRVAVWGKQAESCAEYLTRGRPVLVEGRMKPDDNGNPRVFQRQDGSWGATFEVTAQVVRFLPGRDEAAPGAGNASEFDSPPPPNEDEIPF